MRCWSGRGINRPISAQLLCDVRLHASSRDIPPLKINFSQLSLWFSAFATHQKLFRKWRERRELGGRASQTVVSLMTFMRELLKCRLPTSHDDHTIVDGREERYRQGDTSSFEQVRLSKVLGSCDTISTSSAKQATAASDLSPPRCSNRLWRKAITSRFWKYFLLSGVSFAKNSTTR